MFTGYLRVLIDGLRPGEGQVLVALYADAASWMQPDQAFRRAVLPWSADAGELRVEWLDCPAGIYACSLLMDRNGNFRMDCNLVGYPLEDFAFSNQAIGSVGPPGFEQASFVHDGATTVRLSLR